MDLRKGASFTARLMIRVFADEKYHVDSYIGTRGKQWLEKEAPADRPWFLTLSFPGPHMPFDGIGLPDAEGYHEEEMELPDTNIRDIFNKPPHYLDIAKKFGQLDLKNHTSPDGLTAEDIRLLCRSVQKKVKETSGVDLETEVRMIGWDE